MKPRLAATNTPFLVLPSLAKDHVIPRNEDHASALVGRAPQRHSVNTYKVRIVRFDEGEDAPPSGAAAALYVQAKDLRHVALPPSSRAKRGDPVFPSPRTDRKRGTIPKRRRQRRHWIATAPCGRLAMTVPVALARRPSPPSPSPRVRCQNHTTSPFGRAYCASRQGRARKRRAKYSGSLSGEEPGAEGWADAGSEAFSSEGILGYVTL